MCGVMSVCGFVCDVCLCVVYVCACGVCMCGLCVCAHMVSVCGVILYVWCMCVCVCLCVWCVPEFARPALKPVANTQDFNIK